MSVQYVAFAEMAIHVDGVRQPLTRRRERDVLSVLLVNHGSPVAAERLLADVWGDEGPGQTLSALQSVVSRLRTRLEPDRQQRSGSRLVSTAAGYALVAAVEDVDTWRFEAYAESALAATSPSDRLRLTDEAGALWTGTPYADCSAPVVRAEVGRLEELLLTVQEHRARALIDLGRPDEAQRTLADLAPRHPYRERLWSLLALSQYQCARQADALETLRRLRQALADELGVDPSAEIQQLEQAVLRQDPGLTATTPDPTVPTAAPTPVPTPGSRPTRPVNDPGTVGRQSVLDQAVSQLEDAGATGSMRFLLVAGEPGIGKSRLAADLAAHATATGFRVLVGRCHEGDYAPALWPWLGIVRELAAGATEALDPHLQPLLGGDTVGEVSGGGTGLRMFDAVVALVARAAATRQLLLVLEDIHWADATSLQLLSHLAGVRPEVPVAVVCTRRTTEATIGPALVDAMAALARAGAERVRLDGLDAGSVAALLQSSVGEHDPGLDAVVADVTGGNPFFVLQYARLLAATPDLHEVAPADLPVPDGIRDVLRQRVSRLPDDAATVLTAAAVLGRRIDPDLVSALSELPVERCLDLLDLAMASGLVEEQDAGYAFVHALARETSYAEPSTARRMRLHDRAGRVIEDLHGDVADAAAAIAHHAHLAAPLGPAYAERSCTWLARAADVATGRQAHPESLELWRQ
ncbi:MAG: BTAD domain-containing putative transcriptional regulator, partial [Marmoricola sp.]